MTTDSTAAAGAVWLPGRASASRSLEPDGVRRWLQLGLALIWLLDAVLQYQSFMFTRPFAQMLAGTAAGNPAVIADPIVWAARIVAGNPVATNAAFATIQLLLAVGIACRPTLKAALAASILWSVAVWWFGEGLGGVLTGAASPFNGAPGAVILYALLAVLLWPSSGSRRSPFVAAGAVGTWPAKALWLLLWGSLAYFSVTTANRSVQGLHALVTSMTGGEPRWLSGIDNAFAGLVAQRGLAAAIVLAVALALVGVGVLLPAPWQRVAIVLALVISLIIWVAGEDLGAILAGGATDVNSGPLLALIALSYWPLARSGRPAAIAPDEVTMP
jgi:hypothetical protein